MQQHKERALCCDSGFSLLNERHSKARPLSGGVNEPFWLELGQLIFNALDRLQNQFWEVVPLRLSKHSIKLLFVFANVNQTFMEESVLVCLVILFSLLTSDACDETVKLVNRIV